MYVYVTYDPLFKRIICVHGEPSMECRDCKKADEKIRRADPTNRYTLEEYRFEVKTGNLLIPLK